VRPEKGGEYKTMTRNLGARKHVLHDPILRGKGKVPRESRGLAGAEEKEGGDGETESGRGEQQRCRDEGKSFRRENRFRRDNS